MKETAPEDRNWYLAAKFLTGSLSAAEQEEWDHALADTRFRNAFETLRKHWNKLEDLPYDRIDKEEDWKRVMARIRGHEFSEKRPRRFAALRYAAAIALLLVASVTLWTTLRTTDDAQLTTTIHAPNGTRTFITLPDSSSVWLNAGSKMYYDQEFGKGNRRIRLEGEAFFDVKKSNVPFAVEASDFHITVLGTAFNVKAYPDDDIVAATLLRGSLQVYRATASGKKEEYVLHPNEKLVLKGTAEERGSQPAVLEKSLTAAADADWKDGWLTVRGESLDDLSEKIQRIYDVKIRFEDESLKQYRYNGRIQQLSLEQVLKALSLTSPVKFTIRERNVVLSENPETKSKYQTGEE